MRTQTHRSFRKVKSSTFVALLVLSWCGANWTCFAQQDDSNSADTEATRNMMENDPNVINPPMIKHGKEIPILNSNTPSRSVKYHA